MTDKYRVLVVDDNDVNAAVSAGMLNAFGLETHIAVSGGEAIRMIRETEYSFVLMDFIMPEMDGIEATRRIREFSDVPVYAMTGDDDRKIAALFFAEGASATISKPPKAAELLKIIQNCVPQGGYRVNEDMLDEEPAGRTLERDEHAILLESFMAMVEDLNFAKGLANAGGHPESYVRLVRASSGDIRQYGNELRDYLKTGDPSLLKHGSHCLKIAFSNIGFEGLANESSAIEVSATDLLNDAEISGNIPSFTAEHQEKVTEYISHCMTATLQLEDALEGYMNSLEETGGDNENGVPQTQADAESLAEIMEYTQKALERFEIDYIIEGLKLLEGALTGQQRHMAKEAREAAEVLDYTAVRKLFAEIENSLKEEKEP